MKSAEYNQIVAYLRHAAQSKYRYDDIKARFETEPAASYGMNMARWIPDFAYAHQLLLESIALHLPPNGIGLELGAGSGRVSKLLLETFPDLHLTLVDISANMLGEAASQTADQAREGIVGTYQEDSPLSVRHHLHLLSAAGFAAVDVLYKRDIFAIYVGVK
jgi:SAM-dependent methyltransferase